MKKFDFEEFRAQILFFILCLGLIGIIGLFYYIEENYEITSYLWFFNISVLIIIPLYYIFHSIKEKNKTKKIENSTIIKNIDFKYYREIIEEYSPALLSFILDGTEMKKDFSASIIYLINKGYLKLEEDKIKRTDKDMSKLSEDLQLICNNINKIIDTIENQTKEMKAQKRNDILVSYSNMIMKEWYELIPKQATNKGLATERKEWRMTSLLSILCIIEVFYAISVEAWGLFLFSIILIFLLMLVKLEAYDRNKWVKTQKGYEIYTKIIGLKNYIKDYSMISEGDLEKINLWEDYLIYAIIFNNTSKLNKGTLEFYNKIFNKNAVW